jgi:hypothetical protein
MAKLIYLTIILITINFSIQCQGESDNTHFTNLNFTQSDYQNSDIVSFPEIINNKFIACKCEFSFDRKNFTVKYEFSSEKKSEYSLIICQFTVSDSKKSDLTGCSSYKKTSSEKIIIEKIFNYIFIPNNKPAVVIVSNKKPAPIVIVEEGAKTQDIVIEPKEKEIVTVIDNSKNTIYVNKTSVQPSSVIYNPATPNKSTVTPGSVNTVVIPGTTTTIVKEKPQPEVVIIKKNNTSGSSTSENGNGNCNGSGSSKNGTNVIVVPAKEKEVVITTKKPAPIVIVQEGAKIQDIVIEPKEKEIVTVIDNSKNTIYVNKTSVQPSEVIYNPRTPNKVTVTPGSVNTVVIPGSGSGSSTSSTETPVVPAKQIIIIEEKWEKRTLVTTFKKTTITGDLYANIILNFLFRIKYSCSLLENLNKNFSVTCGIGKDGFKQAISPKLACDGGYEYFVACPCAAA